MHQLCLENKARNGRERNLWIEAKAVDKAPELADFAARLSGVRANGCGLQDNRWQGKIDVDASEVVGTGTAYSDRWRLDGKSIGIVMSFALDNPFSVDG